MFQAPKYFMYFPGNYRWSAAFVNMLGTAVSGGVDISELHAIGRMLDGKSGEDDEAWFDASVKVADTVRSHAEKFSAERHPVSAASFYLRACHYYQMGERFRTPKDARALDAYRKSVECFHQFVALSGSKIEIVDVPFEGKKLPGYFVPAQNAKSAPPPCMVFFDGLDVTKEIQYLRGVPDLVRRGISVLVMDGPGTGEAIRFRGMPLRYDYEKAGGACIAWGAIWDYYGTWKKRIDAGFQASMSVPGHHIMWILGVDSLDAALKKLEPFRLDGVVQKMRCPFLIVHGADDEQIPLKDAQALYDASGSADKTLRVFTAEEGGAQHCQRDYLSLGTAVMWNWLEDKLLGA